MAEKVLVRCPCGGKVSLISYMDAGRPRYDLHTDGRVIITPAIARKLAKKLLDFAESPLARDANRAGER